jgi:hypothetical protein
MKLNVAEFFEEIARLKRIERKYYKLSGAVESFDNDLRSKSKYEGLETLEIEEIRENLYKILNDYGISIFEGELNEESK